MTKRSVDRAVEQFRAGERDLYTDEGQRLYSDEEHERRLEALLETFDREKGYVIAGADKTLPGCAHLVSTSKKRRGKRWFTRRRFW
jgi:hypothetical protein